MILTKKEILITYNELKKRFGHTKEFQKFEKEHYKNIEFIKFRQDNGLRYSKKNGWNKPFINILKTIWIPDRKNYNKGLRKYGYYRNIQTGWRLGNPSKHICLWCGKHLKGKETKFCFDNNGRHRKQFSKVIGIGKKRYGFDLNKQNHILIKPKLFEYDISESGQLIVKETGVERIEHKDIEFSINGKRHPLTKKSRTI